MEPSDTNPHTTQKNAPPTSATPASTRHLSPATSAHRTNTPTVLCPDLEATQADAPGTACPQSATTPLEPSPSMDAAAWQAPPQEWQQENPARSRNHKLRSLEIKPEPDLLQAGLPHRMPQARFVRRIKHQEPATTCPDQFPTERAIGHRRIIPFID